VLRQRNCVSFFVVFFFILINALRITLDGHRYSKYQLFCHILIKMGMFAQMLVKVLIRNFLKENVQPFFGGCMRTDGRMDCYFNVTLQGLNVSRTYACCVDDAN